MAGPPDRVRRAGTGRTAAGEVAWWVVAEGRRGRRWRETLVGEGGLRHVLLLETAPDGRFSHLELATAAGLLTLHPEPDGTLHGNVVADGGVRHVVGLPWTGDGALLVEASPIAAAACAWSGAPAGGAPANGPESRPVLVVGTDLGLAPGSVRIHRLPDGWRLEGDAEGRVDADGLPRLLDARTWPLDLPVPGEDAE